MGRLLPLALVAHLARNTWLRAVPDDPRPVPDKHLAAVVALSLAGVLAQISNLVLAAFPALGQAGVGLHSGLVAACLPIVLSVFVALKRAGSAAPARLDIGALLACVACLLPASLLLLLPSLAALGLFVVLPSELGFEGQTADAVFVTMLGLIVLGTSWPVIAAGSVALALVQCAVMWVLTRKCRQWFLARSTIAAALKPD